MPTVKQIKEELDRHGIKYDATDLKAKLEALLAQAEKEVSPKNNREMVEEMIVHPPIQTGFIDPNADPGTQA